MGDSKPRWESLIQLGALLFGGLLFCVTLVVVTFGIGVRETATAGVAETRRC